MTSAVHESAGIDLVHGPLARWAQERPAQRAIDEGKSHIGFAELHQAVLRRADALAKRDAPATVFIDSSGPVTDRIVDFLGIVQSGRSAAVGNSDWPASLRARMESGFGTQAFRAPRPAHDASFYVGFTSGSTGTPKGFVRNHRSWVESFRVCVETFGPAATECVLAPGGISHSLFLFGTLLGLWTGGGVVVQQNFSAAQTLATLHAGQAPCLVAVPSQLLMMLELARRRRVPPIDAVRLIMISGARWLPERTTELHSLFPQARIVAFYGASETSFATWMEVDEHVPSAVVGRPFANVDIEIRPPLTRDGAGMIFVRSPMLFTGYVGGESDPTAAVRDGDWISVRDLGYWDEHGRLCLVGRQNRMIVTSGENVFPEEIEACLLAHPGIAAAAVLGVPDSIRGLRLVAILQPEPGSFDTEHETSALATWCRERLAAYMVPKRFVLCLDWTATAGGKTDFAALALRLEKLLDQELETASPCRQILP